MNVILTLMRRHLIESRWMLGLSSAAFTAIMVLLSWRAQAYERLVESGEVGPASRGYGFLRALGGPSMDFSTTGFLACFFNHPVIVLTVLSWAISRASSSVAGEIERGTIDITLSRPVPRWAYLTSQVAFALAGLAALAAALVAGCLAGTAYYTVKSPPGLVALLRPAAQVVALGAAVYGYTLLFSASDVVRWRASLAGSAVTLAGVLGISMASMFEGYWFHDWMDKLSVFHVYAPVQVALKGEPLAYNVTVLMLVWAAGVLASYAVFAARDLPSNS